MKGWRTARRVGGALCIIGLASAPVYAVDGEIGGYARCGAEYFAFPAADGRPETWGDILRMNVRLTLSERYTPSEIMTATADDPAFEAAAGAQGQYVIDCAELLESISDEDDWAFEENYFMD